MMHSSSTGLGTPLQRSVYELLDPSPNPPPLERVVNGTLAFLIILNVTLTVLATVPGLDTRYGPVFDTVTFVSLVVFTVEYMARLWVAPLHPGYPSGWRARVKYALTPLAVIDLLVLIALGVPNLADFAALRGLRLLKLLALMKLGRYSKALQLIGHVVRSRAEELATLVVIVTVLVLMTATALYHVENAAGTKCFESIPAAMWWAIVSLTTVGYGDCYPASALGKLLSGGTLLLGVGIVALPAGLIASGFVDALKAQQERPCCPHCGKEL